MASKLSGKVAVVTGGNSGIGLAIAKRFVSEGARVFVTGRRQPELDAAVKALGSNAVGVRVDVSKLADLDNLYATVKAQAGHVDVLVANAGISELAPLEHVTEEHYNRLFDTNVKGTLFTVQRALPLLSNGASVIIVGSMSIKGTPVQRLQCNEGGVRALLDSGAEGPQDPRQRPQPGSHGHARLPVALLDGRAGRAAPH